MGRFICTECMNQIINNGHYIVPNTYISFHQIMQTPPGKLVNPKYRLTASLNITESSYETSSGVAYGTLLIANNSLMNHNACDLFSKNHGVGAIKESTLEKPAFLKHYQVFYRLKICFVSYSTVI